MNLERDRDRLIEFGANLKKTRINLNLSQDQVVSRCDLTKGNLSNIENGKKDFTYTTLLEIAKGLDVPPTVLVSSVTPK